MTVISTTKRPWSAAAIAASLLGVVGIAYASGRASTAKEPVGAEAEAAATTPVVAPPDSPPVVVPDRSPRHPSVGVEPPAVPLCLQHPAPVTATMRSAVGSPNDERIVTRGVERVHVRTGRAEWLFIRNQTDPRRVAAIHIDHEHHALVEYDESELRNLGLARGWADVASFGVGPEAIERTQATGHERIFAGVRFEERRASGSGATLWWSNDLAVPLELLAEGDQASATMRLTALNRSVDENLLADPATRYPSYDVIDVHDAREKLHEHRDG